MQTIKIESDQVTLPFEVVNKLKGKEIRFIEVQEGFLMKPVSDAVKEAKGFLKDRKFSTERYFQMKQQEKSLENE